MNRLMVTTLITGATIVLSAASAYAAPCSTEITRFEDLVRLAETNPDSGPKAPQSIGAQLGHQPTPSSVQSAKERAQTGFETTLARARAFGAQGKDAECMQALDDAKLMFDAQ
jgi:hypothetical protein